MFKQAHLLSLEFPQEVMEEVPKILSNFYIANEMIQYNRRHFCQLYTGHYSGFCEFRKMNLIIVEPQMVSHHPLLHRRFHLG